MIKFFALFLEQTKVGQVKWRLQTEIPEKCDELFCSATNSKSFHLDALNTLSISSLLWRKLHENPPKMLMEETIV